MSLINKILKASKRGKLFETIKKSIKTKKFYNRINKYFDDDRKYLSAQFKFYIGREPNIDNPQSYNEKLLWLKLFWRDERAYQLADKYEVRKYVMEKGFEDILIPLYCVVDKIEDINFSNLPSEFIIKVTHNAGGTYIVYDKYNKKQINEAKKKVKKSLDKGVYNQSKEWVYERIKPRIIVEKLIKDPNSKSLMDYKIFCFNGVAKFIMVATDRSTNVKFDFYDLDWNWLDFKNGSDNNSVRPQKPDNLQRMVEIAETLTSDFPHTRIDLYNVKGRIYFGEITFFSAAGLDPFEPEEYDYMFGECLILPERNV